MNKSDTNMKKGKVIWITGLAGSGKTTLSKALCEELKKTNSNVVHLDGDIIREILGDIHSHSIEDRIKISTIYSNLCTNLSNQGLIVVISTISLFHEIHDLNRKNIENYLEIFLDTPQEVLEQRNQKKLYSHSKSDVMGIHQNPEFPKNPDLIFKNEGKNEIMKKLIIKIRNFI